MEGEIDLSETTRYGISFGTHTDTVVTKIVVNFINNTCIFTERIRKPYDNPKPFIDAALRYVLERMKM